MGSAVKDTEAPIGAKPLATQPKPRSQRLLRLWRRYPLPTIGGVFFLLVLVVNIIAPVVAPYDPGKLDLKTRLAPPSAIHLFGADQLGRDVLSRVIYGGRTVLSGALTAVVIAFCFGVLTGIVAGYHGGWL